MEYHGNISFLKAGICFANKLTTVSPAYAQEILTPEFGFGLEGLLCARAQDLVGILNGVDYESWCPKRGVDLCTPYSASDLAGKCVCKTALQEEFGLAIDANAPLLVLVSRLTEQKMADFLPNVAPTVLSQGGQLAVLGRGERWVEDQLRSLSMAYPGRIAVHIDYSDAMARRLLAGADMLLAPARFEPCGLVQMYAMRYGTVPIVRGVGGLKDTVIDIGSVPHAVPADATGIVFERPIAEDLVAAIERACRLYREPLAWRRLQQRAMSRDFSWPRSAGQYLDIYQSLMADEEVDHRGLAVAHTH
jgi:starch synthase